MGFCSPECPVFKNLADIEQGRGELCDEVAMLQDQGVRTSVIGLCRALIERGECSEGTSEDWESETQVWVGCRNTGSMDVDAINEVIGGYTDNRSLGLRREEREYITQEGKN